MTTARARARVEPSSRMPRGDVPGQRSEDEAAFDLRGVACRIVCVDGEAPRQLTGSGQARVRHIYRSDEVAHFRVGEHCYALLRQAAGQTADAGDAPHAGRDWRAILTNRELQIVQLICLGLLTKQVADRLRLSEFTVRSYLKTIYCKLGVRSRGGMVYAYTRMFGIPEQGGSTGADGVARGG
jgi:DNA-binding CsgD family transcriptional regulator